MGFAQWLWRLFLVYSGLIVVHALLVTWLAVGIAGDGSAGIPRTGFIWLVALGVIALAAGATWYCARRIVQPLSDLTEQVRGVDKISAGLGDFPQRDEIGVLTGAFAQMQRDLAGRLAQIEANNERLETVLSSMAEGVIVAGARQKILLANEAGRRLLDFATAEPVGRPLLQVTRARPVYEALRRALNSNEPVTTEFDAPGVVRRTLSLRATRLPGEPCPGVVMVLHDMTELRRLERVRRDLVANVSHELKTPLAAIKGYAETLRLGAVNDRQHNVQFVRRIEEQADRLHELILDMLQIARLESGQEAFEITDVPVAAVIDACVRQFAKQAARGQIELTARLTAAVDGEGKVRADEESVYTILTNLIDNALKYTPAGGRVTVSAAASDTTVVLEVADTGIGIAEKEQARIFERFYRVDKARSRELGGTGLGLAIVKHLAHAFGGSVSVESQTGSGSIFRVELPRGGAGQEGG